jgi:Gcd10p family
MTDESAGVDIRAATTDPGTSPVPGPSSETLLRTLQDRPDDPRWFIQPATELLLKLPSGNVKVLDRVRVGKFEFSDHSRYIFTTPTFQTQVAPGKVISLGKYGSFKMDGLLGQPIGFTYEIVGSQKIQGQHKNSLPGTLRHVGDKSLEEIGVNNVVYFLTESDRLNTRYFLV